MSIKTNISVIGIIVEDRKNIEELNNVLSEYGDFIIGRLGIPYRTKGVYIISVVLDAESNIIKKLSGKIEKLDCVYTKMDYTS